MSENVIKDRNGAPVEPATREVACWEDAPDAKCLVSYCTPQTREIKLVALHGGDSFSYEEWNGGTVVQKHYRCMRGLTDSS